MSQLLINHSSDLKRLRDEGFEIEITAAHLVVNNIPYLNQKREVHLGRLACPLDLSGNITTRPKTHVVKFAGEFPCYKNGSPIEAIRHSTRTENVTPELTVHHSFSNKPVGGYTDYHEKMTRYIDIISQPAMAIDPNVTPKTFKVIESTDDTPFEYLDTNSSRADINQISDKLKEFKIGIIGVGGTGSYILDLVAKTQVKEIHLFDGDEFCQHNAFRAPGAPSLEALRTTQYKTDYMKSVYSNMHKNVYSHVGYINDSNIVEIDGLNFIFICVDKGSVKDTVITYCEEHDIVFIDVGMGGHANEGKLGGQVRVTTSTLKNRTPVSFEDGEEDEYSTNIQIAELNMLNASLAVIKWKKLAGFYHDFSSEFKSIYTIDGNKLIQ